MSAKSASLPVIAQVIETIPGDISISAARAALRKISAAGGVTKFGNLELRPVEEPAPEPEDDPRDKNGKPLTEVQLRWAEYTRFANENSVQDCRKRAGNDAGFAAYMHTNLVREMNQPVGDDVRDINPHLQQPARTIPPTDEIREFAIAYRKMSAREVRLKRQPGTNPSFSEFNKQVSLAEAAGLI